MKLLRFASLLALAGLAGLAPGQQASEKLFSYSSAARPAGDILSDLSGITGTTLKIGSLAGKDVIAVRLKDVSLQDLMSQMAKALAGEWRQESDGYRLVRSDLEEQRQKRVEAAELAKQLKGRVDAMNAEVDKKPELTEADARKQAEESQRFFASIQNGNRDSRQAATLRAMALQSPGSRAIARVLRNVDLLQLASMGPNTRLVFSTQPTRMQVRFNGAVMPVLTAFVAEQRTFAQAQAQSPNNVEVRISSGATMVAGMPVADGTPTSAILVATRWGFGDSIQLQLQAYDASGNALASGFFNLELDQQTPQAAAAQPAAKPLKISDQALQLAKLMSQGYGSRVISVAVALSSDDGDGQPMSIVTDEPEGDEKEAQADLRTQVLNPEKYEPLAFVGAMMVELAEQRGKNLIAVLPDSLLAPASRFVQAKPTDLGLLAALTEWDLKNEQDDKWMLVTPRRPAAARDSRIDRKALGKLLRTVDKTGNASLDDLGAYALTQPDGAGFGSLDMIYLRLISPVVASRETSNMLANGRDMLRLFATLSPAQRRSLGAGQPLALGSLSANQRAFVHSLVFNSQDGPSVRINTPPSGGPGGREQRDRREGMFGNGRTERTFALPNGLPGDGRITLQLNSESAVIASTDSGTSRFFTAEDLGRQRAMRENPAFASIAGGQARSFTKYRPAMQTTYRFTFVLAPNISMARSLSDTTIPGGVVPGSYDALSADFKDRELAAYQRAKRMFERRGTEEIRVRRGERQGGGAPPP